MYQDKNNTYTLIHVSWQKQYLHSDTCIMTKTIPTLWYMYHDKNNTYTLIHVSWQKQYTCSNTCSMIGVIPDCPTIQFSYHDRSNTYTVVLLELINKFLPVFLCVIHPVDTILVGVGNHPIRSLYRGKTKIWNGKIPYD